MGVTQMFIGSAKQVQAGAFSLATVNPTSWGFNISSYSGVFPSAVIGVGTGDAQADVNLNCVTCTVPAIADEYTVYNEGGNNVCTMQFQNQKVQNPGAKYYQFLFRVNFLSYAPANILQKVGAGVGTNLRDDTDDEVFYVTNVTAGTLRLHMAHGGVTQNSAAVAVASGMHTHEIRWDENANVWWLIDGVIVWSDVTGTSKFPWDQALGPAYRVVHVAGAGSGTYDLNVQFMGGGCVF